MQSKHLLWNGLLAAVAAVEFSWTDISPSHDLQYHPCYEGFQCARIIVPVRTPESPPLKVATTLINAEPQLSIAGLA